MTRSQAPGATGRAGGQLTRRWQWLGRRDHNFAALRRAGRTAIIMPAMFALGDKVIGNADVATFAAVVTERARAAARESSPAWYG